MIVLDENYTDDQRRLLKSWRIPIRQIGYEVGRKGMQDDEILPLLQSLPHPTFFTQDRHFYDSRLCHPRYGLALLAVDELDVALFTRRFLRHPSFRTYAQRRGHVVRVTRAAITGWHYESADVFLVPW